MLSKFDINYAGRLMFGAEFLMTGSFATSILRGNVNGTNVLGSLQDVTTDFVENLPLHQLRNVWFQHDGATLHKISNVTQYLRRHSRNKYGGFVEWPPRSPELTPLDFF
ncbi:hypothetical protein AVEN_176598-1 [Araneus ventricosus]|uniref:Tc1-like transposase DDE domain-containing protein n=1 Tax=Araneus ventricosus TaxID=182803 RepID=A0A4Y2EJR5_ARAVE|nr:hypothetical protein AVEN_176598-1 [Araneus ventricosus]